jgi:hypothetical protein
MKDLTLLIEITRRMETQLVRVILSSWLFSTLAIIIQHRQFDIAFSTLVTIVGGVVGTAAILSVYLRRIQHPAFMVDCILRNRPFGGTLAFVLMLSSAVCFFFYYSFAKQSNELCVLFFGAGTFLFFYTLADAASRMLVNEQQKILWQSMEAEERRKWRQENDPKIIQLERLQQQLKELKATSSISEEELDRQAQELADKELARRERREQFVRRVRDGTYPFRKLFGLVSKKEKMDREIEALRKEDRRKIWLNWGDSLHEQNTARIINSEVKPITLEATGLQIYEFGDRYKYFVVNEDLNQSKAEWYLGALNVLGGQRDALGRFEFIAGIILPNVEVTYEARKILENNGIVLYKHVPKPDSADEALQR